VDTSETHILEKRKEIIEKYVKSKSLTYMLKESLEEDV
jgi:hypothetical protein